MTTIYWYNLLTRDHMFCSLCYRDYQLAWKAETKAGIPHPPEREAWVRITDVAWFAEGITLNRRRAAYITKLRAAFRRHVAAVHPVLAFTIGWARTPR